MTYTFKYGADIAVGNQITLGLPNWANTETLSTSSTCGSTAWALSPANSGSTYSVTLQAATDTLSAGTSCSAVIQGLTNPSVKLPANYASIMAAVSGATPAQSATAISTTPELVAKLHEDSISLSKAFTGASDGTLTYTFKYGADIAVGNQITLTLPNWVNSTAISSSSTCGTSSTSWLLSTANSGSTYSVTLQAATANFSAGTSCSVVIQGLTNPSVKLPANYASITAAVSGTTPAQSATAISTTPELVAKLHGDSITLSKAFTGASDGTLTYTFKYGADIAVGNKITLGLPNRTNTVTLSTSSTCGSTAWALSPANSGSTYSVTLQAATANFSAGTSCSVVIEGLTNPSVKLPANYASITAAVSGTTPAQSATAISTTPELVAKLHGDSISLSKAFTGASDGTLTYTFKYGADIAVGNQITLGLPNWASYGALASTSTCTDVTTGGNTAWNVSPSGSADSFKVVLEALANSLDAGSSCSVAVTGLSTPSVAVPSNSNVFTAAVSGTSPTQIATAIQTSPAIIAKLHADNIYVATPITSASSNVTFSFAFGANISIGNNITLVLPNFANTSISTSSTCGTTSWLLSTANSGSTYSVTLQAATSTLSAGTSGVVIQGLTNPSVKLPANSASITAAVSGTTPPQSATAIRTTSAIATAGTTMSFDSIILSNTGTGAINTYITYTFAYGAEIGVGNQVALVLPNFANTSAISTSSTCGTTSWLLSTANSGSTYSVTLQAATAPLSAGTSCSVVIQGLTNPSVKLPANYASITAAVSGSNVMSATTVTQTAAVIAKLHGDSISLSKAFTGTSNGTLTYTFKYGADIAVGNQITLTLPNWVNSTAISSSSTCGTGSTSWLLSTANSGSTYSVTLQAATANFSAGTSCSVVIQGLTNPSVKLPANYASITAAVSGTTPAQSATAISTTPELVAKLHGDSTPTIKQSLHRCIGWHFDLHI